MTPRDLRTAALASPSGRPRRRAATRLRVACALALAASTSPAQARPPQSTEPVRVRWSVEPASPRAGEVFAATAVVELDETWSEDALVQLFPQPLDVPLQLEGFAAERGALEWLSAAGLDPGADAPLDARASLATLAVEGRVRAAVRTSPVPGTLRLEVRRLARAPRPGEVVLAPPRAAYSAATRFREDLLRGRVPIDPVAGEAVGDPARVEVRALPETGRPPAFSGAVGGFALRAADVEEAAIAGEPFTVTVTLRHDRALAPGIRPSLAALPEGLALLGTTVDATVPDASGAAAARGAGETPFSFSLTAAREGPLDLPAAELFAFDPAADAYRRHTAAPGSIEVLPAGAMEPARATRQADPPRAGEAPPLPHIGGDAGDLRWTLGVLAALFALAVLSVVRRRLGSDRVRGPLARAHVAVFGRDPLDAATGGAVAARGLVRRLRARGLRVSYLEPDDDDAALPAPPTVCHALGAGAAATRAAGCAGAMGARLVITATDADVRALESGEGAGEVRANLARADSVTARAAAHAAALAREGVDAARIGSAVDDELVDLANGYADEAALRERVGAAAANAEVAIVLGGAGPAAEDAVALDAFAELARRRAPEATRWHLAVLAGEDHGDDAATWRARAATLPNVTLLPRVPHGEALVALAAAGALVATGSGGSESRAILEAQALQVPVLARRGEGSAALVEDGVTGRLFDDARGLADALELLLADRGLARRLTEAARVAAEERGSARDEIDAYLRVYASALASARPRAAKAGQETT